MITKYLIPRVWILLYQVMSYVNGLVMKDYISLHTVYKKGKYSGCNYMCMVTWILRVYNAAKRLFHNVLQYIKVIHISM